MIILDTFTMTLKIKADLFILVCSLFHYWFPFCFFPFNNTDICRNPLPKHFFFRCKPHLLTFEVIFLDVYADCCFPEFSILIHGLTILSSIPYCHLVLRNTYSKLIIFLQLTSLDISFNFIAFHTSQSA